MAGAKYSIVWAPEAVEALADIRSAKIRGRILRRVSLAAAPALGPSNCHPLLLLPAGQDAPQPVGGGPAGPAQVTVTADFHCLVGWVARGRSWQGVPLAAVLERAGLRPGARFVAVCAADHDGAYNAVLDREQALTQPGCRTCAPPGRGAGHSG